MQNRSHDASIFLRTASLFAASLEFMKKLRERFMESSEVEDKLNFHVYSFDNSRSKTIEETIYISTYAELHIYLYRVPIV